jgi:hypothetical protein
MSKAVSPVASGNATCDRLAKPNPPALDDWMTLDLLGACEHPGPSISTFSVTTWH